MSDLLVAEIVLDRSGIDALVRQVKARGMTEHVRVNGKLDTSLLPGTSH